MKSSVSLLKSVAALCLLACATMPVCAQTTGTDPVAQVTGVTASGKDLVVHVQWSDTLPLPSTATLTLQSSAGVVRASQPLSPTAGDTDVVLPAVLQPQDMGTGFQVSVVDSSQEPLSALPFDLVLACDDPFNCRLQARPGAAAGPGSQVLSQTMDAALTASLASTTRTMDVLQDVMTNKPALIGETYTYAYGVARVQPALPVGQCFCQWNTVNLLSPDPASEMREDADPAHERGWQGPGAAHTLRAWYDGGLASATHEMDKSIEGTSSQTTLKLNCAHISGWRAVVIHIFGINFTIYVPIIDAGCPKCTGTVDTRAEYYADTSAFVDAGWFGSGEAAAQEEGLFSVNGQALINRISQVGKEVRKSWAFSLTIPGLGSIQEDNGTTTVSGSPTSNFKAEIKYEVNGSDGTVAKNIVSTAGNMVFEPATAQFQSKAYAYAQGNSDTDAEGKSTMSYLYALHGSAACALPTDTATWVYYSYNGRTKQLQTNIKNYFAGFNIFVNP